MDAKLLAAVEQVESLGDQLLQVKERVRRLPGGAHLRHRRCRPTLLPPACSSWRVTGGATACARVAAPSEAWFPATACG